MKKLKTTLSDAHLDASDDTSLNWSDFTTKIARKAILIGVVLVAMNQFTGVVAMLSYTGYIFEEAGSDMSPNRAAVGKYIYSIQLH